MQIESSVRQLCDTQQRKNLYMNEILPYRSCLFIFKKRPQTRLERYGTLLSMVVVVAAHLASGW
jgi:hypothetical protein